MVKQKKQKRKHGKGNKKSKVRTKTILFVIGIFLCLGSLLLFELGTPLLVESFIGAIGMILAFPTMKEGYDDYQNGEASVTVLVRFLGYCAAVVLCIIFCISITIFTIQDVLGRSG